MPPPTDLAELPSKKVRLVVSSGDRNLSTYPTPASYMLTFDEPFVDVVSMTLLSASLPLCAHQVSSSNDTFAFSSNDRTYTVVIPRGDYEPPETLASVLTDLMNDACGVVGLFTVNYDPRIDGFKFGSGTPFRLLFDGGTVAFGPQIQDEFGAMTSLGIVENLAIAGDRGVTYPNSSAARVLGFGPTTYDSSGVGYYVLTSMFRRDVSHTQSAVICIDGADVNVSVNNVFNRSYAIITKQTSLESWLADRNVSKTFNPPMGKMAKIRVRVFDIYGNPYDFQNHDHRLEFQLACSPRYQSKPNWTVRAD